MGIWEFLLIIVKNTTFTTVLEMSDSETNKPDGLIQPGEIIRPQIEESQVPGLVERLYGLAVVSLKELNGYDDKNYLIQVSPKSSNPHLTDIPTSGFVLKIMNSLDSRFKEMVDAQNKMMVFLGSKGFRVPTPVKNLQNSYIKEEVFSADSKTHIVRLLTFLPGKLMYHVPYTHLLLNELGELIAKIDSNLKSFVHDGAQRPNFIWMLPRVVEVKKFLYVIKDDNKRNVVQQVLAAWESDVAPLIPTLETGPIHGDINHQNIIVRQDDKNPSIYHVDGLIDFGDIHTSCYMFELAVALTYTMLESNSAVSVDTPGYVLAGFLKHSSLTETEWNILKVCICARLCQSLVMGAYTNEIDPSNQYVLSTAPKGWKLLEVLWNIPNSQLIKKWKEIAGLLD